MESKLKISPFFFISLPPIFLFVFLGIPEISSTYYNLKNGLSNDISGILIPIILLVITCYLFINIVNSYPKLSINENGIKLSSISKKAIYSWGEIKKIELTGKKKYVFLFSSQVEALTFYLKNGDEKNLWIDQYSNSSEIRSFLEQTQSALIDKSHIASNINSKTVAENKQILENSSEEEKIYNDYNLFDEDRIFIYIIFLINLIFICINISKLSEYYILIIFSICASLLFIFIIAQTDNYFIVNKENITVRNNILFWKQKKYDIENIKEIAIEQHRRTPILLRIITKKYETHIVGASSLKKRTWKRLSNDFEQKNIVVRNEIKLN